MVREEYDATDLSENLIWGVHLVFNGVGLGWVWGRGGGRSILCSNNLQ